MMTQAIESEERPHANEQDYNDHDLPRIDESVAILLEVISRLWRGKELGWGGWDWIGLSLSDYMLHSEG